MKKLINDERWYVLKADQEGITVIWGREYYKMEAKRRLGDPNTYMELSKAAAEGHRENTKTQNLNHHHKKREPNSFTGPQHMRKISKARS